MLLVSRFCMFGRLMIWNWFQKPFKGPASFKWCGANIYAGVKRFLVPRPHRRDELCNLPIDCTTHLCGDTVTPRCKKSEDGTITDPALRQTQQAGGDRIGTHNHARVIRNDRGRLRRGWAPRRVEKPSDRVHQALWLHRIQKGTRQRQPGSRRVALARTDTRW